MIYILIVTTLSILVIINIIINIKQNKEYDVLEKHFYKVVKANFNLKNNRQFLLDEINWALSAFEESPEKAKERLENIIPNNTKHLER